VTDEAAQRYDTQVEVLFNGTANATRRQVLPPLGQVFAGRDQRRLRLLDVGCGFCARPPHPGAPDPNPRADRASYRSRGARVGRLSLYPSASSLAGARHHHGHCQRPKAAATHSSDIDPPHATAVAPNGDVTMPSGGVFPKNWKCFRDSVTDNFRVISQKDFRVVT